MMRRLVTTDGTRVRKVVTWWPNWTTKDASNGQQEVKLLVADLKKILRIEFYRWSAGEVEDAFNEATVFTQDF